MGAARRQSVVVGDSEALLDVKINVGWRRAGVASAVSRAPVRRIRYCAVGVAAMPEDLKQPREA